MPRFLSVLAVVCLFNPAPSQAQSSPAQTQTATSSPQAAALLQKSLAALVGQGTISDIELTGSVRRIAGSKDETGSATLKASSNGSAGLDFSFLSGNFSQVSNFFAANPSGAWSGTDNVLHPIPSHNLLAETAWFCPSIVVARRLSSANLPSGYTFVVTYVAHETFNGQDVEHVSVSQIPSVPDPPGLVSFQHLSQVEFYLDSTTSLPAAISFNVHPDDNALLDIPVQVRFSDYRSVFGIQVPFRVQEFLNNGLTLDLVVQNAVFNSGLSSASFNVQ